MLCYVIVVLNDACFFHVIIMPLYAISCHVMFCCIMLHFVTLGNYWYVLNIVLQLSTKEYTLSFCIYFIHPLTMFSLYMAS